LFFLLLNLYVVLGHDRQAGFNRRHLPLNRSCIGKEITAAYICPLDPLTQRHIIQNRATESLAIPAHLANQYILRITFAKK